MHMKRNLLSFHGRAILMIARRSEAEMMHQDWKEIADFYDDWATIRPNWKSVNDLADLCRYIASSGLGDFLFGHTSAETLMISQVETAYPPAPEIQWLIIDPIDHDRIEFRFDDTPVRKKQWIRVVKSSDACDRFLRFLRQVGWSYEIV
jgi:hypothetical protein